MTTAPSRLLLVVLLGAVLPASAAEELWPYAAENLAPAKEWVWGRLDNGFRYVLRRNTQPAGHISLRFSVQVGFAHETKTERGLAHFVEHMAFNGTTHFPGESLLADLQKHGVALGPELSAFTLLTHTIYGLDAPATAPADLDRWFTVLRDFADGIRFDAKQVKRERGVIASETRDRASAGSRADAARRLFLYPLSSLSNRLEGDVEAADPKTLRAFYDKWYRPERMILVVVGDVEPAQLEALVHRHFDSLRARTMPAPRFDPGYIENPPEALTEVRHDAKVSGFNVEVTSVLPREAADSLGERRQWFARQLLLYLLNVRLQEVVRNNPGKLFELAARSNLATPYSLETLVTFSAPSTEWKFALTTLEQELRRSFEYTFTSDELNEARAVLLTMHERQVKTSATAKSDELAANLMQESLWRLVSTSPEDQLRLAREWLPQIDVLEMNREWRSLWQQKRARIFGYGFFPMLNGRALVSDAFNESLAKPIQAPAARRDLPFAYTDFGPPGKVRRREHLPELDVDLLEFENGVRVNLKRTTYEAATVRLTARLGRGMQSEPPTLPGLGAMAGHALLNGALGRHPPEELRRVLSASTVGVNFSCQETYFGFDGQASSPSLDLLLRLVTAYLTDPGWNPEAVAVAKARLSTFCHDQNYTPEGIIGLHCFHLLTGRDQRYTLPTVEQVKARTVEELRQWIDPVLRSAPLEIGLVGDFELEPAIELLSRTVGALPARVAPPGPDRPVVFAKQRAAHQFHFEGENNRAGMQVVWPVEHYDDIKVSRRMEVLCAIFGDRLRQKVREDLGAAYSPAVSGWKSEASRNDGYVTAYLTVKPQMVPRLTKLMVEIADQLARKGVTAAELAQAREPIVARALSDLKDNGYWMWHILSKIQSEPEARTWPLTRAGDFQTMTPADVNALARTTLPASHAISFTALPGSK